MDLPKLIYSKYIENFKNTMLKVLSEEDYNILESNLNNNIVKFNRRFKKNDSTPGNYNFENKIITLYGHPKPTTIYHELLHASSSYYNGNIKEIKSGFHHQNLAGLGLNEGYTELLTNRFFEKQKDSGYLNEWHYAYLIEKLVGADKMQTLYFKSDLNGLIVEMSKYNSLENIKKFLDNLNVFQIMKEVFADHPFQEDPNYKGLPSLEHLEWLEEAEQYMEKAYNDLNQFIIESYINKVKESPNYNKDIEELISVMSVPLYFNCKQYNFDIRKQIDKNLNESKQL